MGKQWILAVDQGTTNTKAFLYDIDGRPVYSASVGMDLMQPSPGFVEQDPVQLWNSVRTVMIDCAGYAKKNQISVAGIAISNQRETALGWRRKPDGNGCAGTPVCNAISWQCRRSTAICGRFTPAADLIQKRTGLPLDPLLTATKWAWLFTENPALQEEAQRGEVLLGTVDTWILYNLTGGHVHATDHTNASRVALLNLATLDWDEDLLSLFGIARKALPQLLPSSCIFGNCSSIPELEGVPVLSMMGDSHAALVGHACTEIGAVKATYGTGSSLMMATPTLPREQKALARTIAWSLSGKVQYALEGNIAMSGAAVQWVGEFLGLPDPASDAAVLAEKVEDAAGVVLVPAMVGLGAPYWDATARGEVMFLERSHVAAHMARAAVDSIAQQVTDVLEAMEAVAGVRLPVLLADGGATRNQTLMQLQADLMRGEVRRSDMEELSARGTALMAGLVLGWWKSIEDFAALPYSCTSFHAEMPSEKRQYLRSRWQLAITKVRLQMHHDQGVLSC